MALRATYFQTNLLMDPVYYKVQCEMFESSELSLLLLTVPLIDNQYVAVSANVARRRRRKSPVSYIDKTSQKFLTLLFETSSSHLTVVSTFS